MLRGLVKNWASAMDAFGKVVSAFTEIPIEPLPTTPDLPTGAGTTARSPYNVALFFLTSRTRFGAVCQKAAWPAEKSRSPVLSSLAMRMSLVLSAKTPITWVMRLSKACAATSPRKRSSALALGATSSGTGETG